MGIFPRCSYCREVTLYPCQSFEASEGCSRLRKKQNNEEEYGIGNSLRDCRAATTIAYVMAMLELVCNTDF